MGSSISNPHYVDVTYVGKGKGNGWGIDYSITDLLIIKLSLSLLDFWMNHQKKRMRKFTISSSIEYFKPIFIESFTTIRLAFGVLVFLCFPLTFLPIPLHPTGMFYLRFSYQFPLPALLLQTCPFPLGHAGISLLLPWRTELFRRTAAPRSCLSASVPTGWAPAAWSEFNSQDTYTS